MLIPWWPVGIVMNISSMTKTTIPMTLANCSVSKPLNSFGGVRGFRNIAPNLLFHSKQHAAIQIITAVTIPAWYRVV